MQAAAHTPGGFGGVSQEVGKKMTQDDAEGSKVKAAGIMFVTDSGSVCLLRRADGGDYPGYWGIPGGHIEADETPEVCARREALEETGFDYKGDLQEVYNDGNFSTYLAKPVTEFPIKICDESTASVWAQPNATPQPLHPGLEVPFRVANATTETDIARLMADGHLSSPQVYANMHLIALRITGTGLAYRSALGEHVWRDESLYLNDEFLARCNGLAVIMDHPPKSVLDSKEFKKRVIGMVLLPYIRGNEVWGIAKVYDDKALTEILKGDISTSPSVVFDETAGNTTLQTNSGEPLLIEGKAFLVDHLAIVTKDRGSRGVWDKGQEPHGVELNNPEIAKMADESTTAKADAASDKLDKILSVAISTATQMTALAARVDAMEKNMPAPPLQPINDKKKADGEGMEKSGENVEGGEKKKEIAAADKKRKDAAGSKPTEEGSKAGEVKPDDDDDEDTEGKEKIKEKVKPDDDDDGSKAERMAAKNDAEAVALSAVQAKADSVLAAFGKAASRPLQGETLRAYRIRLLKGIQGYSDAYKAVNLRSINDEALLDQVEAQIFHDARIAARAPAARGDSLIEHRATDRAGRMISTFTGPVSAWLDDFKLPPMRVTRLGIPETRDRF